MGVPAATCPRCGVCYELPRRQRLGWGPRGMTRLARGYLAGLGLVLWIAVQMLVLQRYFIMQPAIAGAGVIEILLAWLWQRKVAVTRWVARW